MATIDNAFRDLWHAVKSTIPLNDQAAIYKAWCNRYQEWGSPIGNEMPLDEEPGAVAQCFSHAIVRWTPSRGIEVVTG